MKRLSIAVVLLGSLGILASTAAASHATPAGKAKVGQAITIRVKADDQHAKKGPDGKWHDAFLPASFSVKAGVATRVTIVNYDSGAHSLISPSLGLNVKIPAAKGSKLGTVTFTIDAKKAGRYDWWCASPCDPWSMTHNGFMRGFITATA